MVAIESRNMRQLVSVAVAAASVVLTGLPSEAAPPKPKPMVMPLVCDWGYTAQHTCVNPRQASDMQRAQLVYSQQFINRNNSPYTSANPGVERQYPILSIEWWTLRVNSTP